jgi:hypothetical protein
MAPRIRAGGFVCVMLLNVRSDRDFQNYLDRIEQRLHVAMVPILAHGMRMVVRQGGVLAHAYIVGRGQPVLLKVYKRIYRDVYSSVPPRDQLRKARDPWDWTEGVNDFLDGQLDHLEREAGSKIVGIATSTADAIRDILVSGVGEGLSNNAIARDIYDHVGEFSQDRSARIARTETHGAAMDAMDESLDDKDIEVATKTWWTASDARVRPSHAAMHGVEIGREDPFELDGGDMMYPGDDSLGVDEGEIINCRCSVLYNT